MILFLIKLSAYWGVFALLYHILLRKETFFQANRLYLLLSAALGLILPQLEFTAPAAVADAPAATVLLPAVTVGLEQTQASVAGAAGWPGWWHVYLAGAGLTLARLLWGLAQLVRLAWRARREPLADGAILLHSADIQLPFSFFRWIFVPHDWADRGEHPEVMLVHERAHVHGRHSADVLFAELLCIVFWFHPLAHWYRRTLRTVHEYLADADAAAYLNRRQYGLMLVRQAQGGFPIAFAHHFYQSPLKQRLLMLTRGASAPIRRFKYGLLAPPAAGLVLLLQQAPTVARVLDAPAMVESSIATNKTDTPIDPAPARPKPALSRGIASDPVAAAPKPTAAAESPADSPSPEFPGGVDSLMRYLSYNIQYPEADRAEKRSGLVLVRFNVDASGAATEVETLPLNGEPSAAMLDEARRVVETMPRWSPASVDGKAVPAQMQVPIRFKLE